MISAPAQTLEREWRCWRYLHIMRRGNKRVGHECQLAQYHPGWHLCWCGCAFDAKHVIALLQDEDAQEAFRTGAYRLPEST